MEFLVVLFVLALVGFAYWKISARSRQQSVLSLLGCCSDPYISINHKPRLNKRKKRNQMAAESRKRNRRR